MQYRFVMFQTQAVSSLTFRCPISMQAKIVLPSFGSSCSEKSRKTGKHAPSVTGGQWAVTLSAPVSPPVKDFQKSLLHSLNGLSLVHVFFTEILRFDTCCINVVFFIF